MTGRRDSHRMSQGIYPALPAMIDKLLISNSGLNNEPEASGLVSKRQINQKRFSLTIFNTLKHFYYYYK